ncbi:MAG TPA: enoyl-CoA hydratase/isomerase family protein [Candidatus Poseidoniaceae archaeon]|jgi:enoyl-CoA hydratase/carnithine racemase|nr:enoyl-CoA hydratase/isomerase family protein [Candidatus Poseidoniaceae archaeon]
MSLELKAMPNNLVNYGVTENGIAVIELSSDSDGKPLTEGKTPVNTYTREMWEDIDQAILNARFDGDVNVILLTGKGDKFFSAGASINYLNSLTPRYKYFFCLHANETLSRLEQTPKLVIAALNGHTVGGGLEIAMAADIRIARKNAGKLGLPEINLGVLAGTGGTARLTRLIGKAKALELMVTGELISFEDANEMHLVNQIIEANGEEFRRDVLDWAGQFTLPNKAVKAVGNIKRSVQTGIELPLEYHLALERELQSDLFQSNDAKEGIAAYVNKKVANFTGE